MANTSETPATASRQRDPDAPRPKRTRASTPDGLSRDTPPLFVYGTNRTPLPVHVDFTCSPYVQSIIATYGGKLVDQPEDALLIVLVDGYMSGAQRGDRSKVSPVARFVSQAYIFEALKMCKLPDPDDFYVRVSTGTALGRREISRSLSMTPLVANEEEEHDELEAEIVEHSSTEADGVVSGEGGVGGG